VFPYDFMVYLSRYLPGINKGKAAPMLNQASRHEDVWRSGAIAPLILILAPDGGKCLASRPRRYNPGETAPSTHWTGDWMVS
jgi:hypothetical protein